MNTIKQIRVTNPNTGTSTLYNLTIADENASAAALPSGVNSILEVNTKPNVTLSSPAKGANGKGGKINIEAEDDIQLKPGDDISFISSHRGASETDPAAKQAAQLELKLNFHDGNDVPIHAKLELRELTILSNDPVNLSDNEYMDVNFLANATKNKAEIAGQEYWSYVTMKARAWDIRCNAHGGIALLPFGSDKSGNMNKIKFEHGGGNGLEFGTFNTDKASLYTGEYRFNKHGLVKMATRTPVASNKMVSGKTYDNTQKLAYVKAADDFYDTIEEAFHIENQTKIGDEQATWQDIIKTAYTFNGDLGVKTGISKKGNFQIETLFTKFYWRPATEKELAKIDTKIFELLESDVTPYFTLSQLSSSAIGSLSFDSITLNSSERVHSPAANVNGVTVTVPLTPGELESALNEKKHDAVKHLNDLIGTRYLQVAEAINPQAASVIEPAEYKDKNKAVISRNNVAIADRKYIYLVYNEETQLYTWECKKKSKVPAEVVTFNDASDISIYTLTLTMPTTKAEIDAALTVAYECPATDTSGGTGTSVSVLNIQYTAAGYVVLEGLEDGARNINIESGNTIKLEAPYVELIGTKENVVDTPKVTIKNPAAIITVGTESVNAADIVTFVNWAKTNNFGPWANT